MLTFVYQIRHEKKGLIFDLDLLTIVFAYTTVGLSDYSLKGQFNSLEVAKNWLLKELTPGILKIVHQSDKTYMPLVNCYS